MRALVRNPEKGAALAELGCELVPGTLADKDAIRAGMEGCDAAIHGAAVYEVGIPESRAPGDVRGERDRDRERAARGARGEARRRSSTSRRSARSATPKGQVVDESYEHPGTGFTSYYEETKYEAHRLAKRLIAEEGLPCVIVQPGRRLRARTTTRRSASR